MLRFPCLGLSFVILAVVGGLLTLLYEVRLNPERFDVLFRAHFETWRILGQRNHMKHKQNKRTAQRDQKEIEGRRTGDNESKQFKFFDAVMQTWLPPTTERVTERGKLVGETTREEIRQSASLRTISSFEILKQRKLDVKPILSSSSIFSTRTPPHVESAQPLTKSAVYGETGCRDNPWRKELVMLLRQWIHLTSEHHIEYVLAYGSLLGAARDGDVIPYDSDIDVLIDVNYFSVMTRLASQRNFSSTSDDTIRLVLQPEFTQNIPVETRKRYDCYGKETSHMVDQCSFQEPLGRLIKGKRHIDIFHFYDRVRYVDDPSDDRLKQYSKEHFYPFRPCGFMGVQASCPNKPWNILSIYFRGDDLRPLYTCKNGSWVDRHGKTADVF